MKKAGYGSRTRLLGLGSRCTTDVLILHIYIHRSEKIKHPNKNYEVILVAQAAEPELIISLNGSNGKEKFS